MNGAAPRVAVIIPTTCEKKRWKALERAMDGVLAQEGVEARLIVVVNGTRYDPEAFEQLRAREGERLTVLYRAQGSAPLAQLAGREIVDTPFFAFLDDDDEYLPGALATRIAPLLADPGLDFVVTNGVRDTGAGDGPTVPETSAIQADPLLALARRNWIASCGGLFRTSSIGPGYFTDPAPYMEWTFLAFRLLVQHRMRFLDVPTYRLHDSPGSLSKSSAYLHSEAEVLDRVLALPLPAAVRRVVRRKLGNALHAAAELHLRDGQRQRAWDAHLASLRQPGGWRYLLYSRKLAFAAA
jgi:glycosyltransferase involved in cell wall biosynthesis